MDKTKASYEKASLEIIWLSHSDIMTASGDGTDGSATSAPGYGDWDDEGWVGL